MLDRTPQLLIAGPPASRPAFRTSFWWLPLALCGCQASNSAVPTNAPVAGQSGSGGFVNAMSSTAGAAAGVPAATSGGSGAGSGAVQAGSAANGGSRAVADAGRGGGGSASVEPAVAGTGGPSGATMNTGCRPAKYTLATRVTLDVTWDETLGIIGSGGQVYLWGKLTLQQTAGGITTEYRVCGTQTPIYMTTPVGGSIKVYQTVPQATFDGPDMPRVMGTATQLGSMLKVEPGTIQIGIQLADPQAPWPATATASGFTLVDADMDGKPGITAVIKSDEGFAGPPPNVLQLERIDLNFGASRQAYSATALDPDCADTLEGTAEVTAWDSLFAGCRVKDRGDCTGDEITFINENRPRFKAGKATWSAKVIPDDATCAQARQALAVPGPSVPGT